MWSEKSCGWFRAQSGVRTERREGAHSSAGKNLEIYGITREEAEQNTRRQRRHRRQRDKTRQI